MIGTPTNASVREATSIYFDTKGAHRTYDGKVLLWKLLVDICP